MLESFEYVKNYMFRKNRVHIWLEAYVSHLCVRFLIQGEIDPEAILNESSV